MATMKLCGAMGGCANNGSGEARAHASYLLVVCTGQQQLVRPSDLPNVSINNQAEYIALVSALVDLRGRIERAGKNPRYYTVVVHADS
jgi:hypothetical protein